MEGINGTSIPTTGQSVAFPGGQPAAGTDEFLVKGIRGSTAHCTIRVTVWAKDPKLNKKEPVDSARITFEDVSNYWHLVSTRGAKSSEISNYPVEGGRTVTLPTYPEAYPVQSVNDGGISYSFVTNNPNRKKYFVFIHGYNTSERGALEDGNTLFRRIYWVGFRGNFVAFNWEGDDGRIPFINKTLFDPNVENAFDTAPRLEEYLTHLGQNPGVGPGNIDIMAHSLGNLVAMEALRYQANILPGVPLCHNYTTVEAAIWR
ncbi:MAG: alpha/beta hydrolase, partial [Phycisphaerae bacterium]